MLTTNLLLQAYTHICQSIHMANLYNANRSTCNYVHSTSLGHQAVQLAVAYNLLPTDYEIGRAHV